jgi:hypothetical protein
MRIISLVCAGIVSICMTAQTPYTREKVLEIDSITPADVFRGKARQWFVNTFKDANEVIQMDDDALNMIIGKGWTEFGDHAGLHYTIEVACKKGRVRYRIYDVHHKGRGMINLGAGPMPAISLGTLYDEERCYEPVRAGFQSQAGAERQMLKHCIGVRTEIDKRLDSICISLEEHLREDRNLNSTDW